MKDKRCATHVIEIHIAGDYQEAKRICRVFTFDEGLCVTLEPCEFIYTGGAEAGVKVVLRNYPRFPRSRTGMWGVAYALAEKLRSGLCQRSVMLLDYEVTTWITTREETI